MVDEDLQLKWEAELSAALSMIPGGGHDQLSRQPEPSKRALMSDAEQPEPKRQKAEQADIQEEDLGTRLKNALDAALGPVVAPVTPVTPTLRSASVTSMKSATPESLPRWRLEEKTSSTVAATLARQRGESLPKNMADKIMKASSNPRSMMRSMSLPVLGNTAVQILLRLAQQSCEETKALLAQGDSEFAETFSTLRQVFELTRNTFSTTTTPLLCPLDLELTDEDDRETIRMANLASVGLSAFGTNDISLENIHTKFRVVFIPEDIYTFSKDTADLYISLKTHAFLNGRTSGEDKDHIMGDLAMYFCGEFGFPKEASQELLGLMVEERKALCLTAMAENKGPWTECLREKIPAWTESVSAFLQLHMPVIIEYSERYGVNIPLSEEAEVAQSPDDLKPGETSPEGDDSGVVGLADFIAEKMAEMDAERSANALNLTSQVQQATLIRRASQTDNVLPPNQTQPSQVLYDRARQAAASSRTTTHSRREGVHSSRRPWTVAEERALMVGLDMAKGPHWSQILLLFGERGSVSQALKDRTQVQLKDKARNLKLFFLKTNCEMPHYLTCVTGELKTRAPGQAARKEAEEKFKRGWGEERAKMQGINVLADGLGHGVKAVVPSASPVTAPGPAGQAMIQPRPQGQQTQGFEYRPVLAQTPKQVSVPHQGNQPPRRESPQLAADAIRTKRLQTTVAEARANVIAIQARQSQQLQQTQQTSGPQPANVPAVAMPAAAEKPKPEAGLTQPHGGLG